MVTIPGGLDAPQRSPLDQSTWTVSPLPVGRNRAMGAPVHSLRSVEPRATLRTTTPPEDRAGWDRTQHPSTCQQALEKLNRAGFVGGHLA